MQRLARAHVIKDCKAEADTAAQRCETNASERGREEANVKDRRETRRTQCPTRRETRPETKGDRRQRQTWETND